MRDLIETTAETWESEYSTYITQGYNLKTIKGQLYWARC